jgi:hypothetical protein
MNDALYACRDCGVATPHQCDDCRGGCCDGCVHTAVKADADDPYLARANVRYVCSDCCDQYHSAARCAAVQCTAVEVQARRPHCNGAAHRPATRHRHRGLRAVIIDWVWFGVVGPWCSRLS